MSGIYAELPGFVEAHRARGIVSIFMTALARPAPMIRSMPEAATGFLHIVRLTDAADPVMAEYRIAFAPLGGRLRGRHVTRQGLDALTDFLRQAGVPIPEIERAWRTLARHRFHAIPRVTLTPAQLEALGL